MYSGCKANFVKLEKSMFLRLDPARKIVRQETALSLINNIFSVNASKDKDERRQLVKSALINKIVMSNYGRAMYYRVTDIEFNIKDLESVPVDEKEMNLLQYYQEKYKIDIKPKQPLLVT